MKLSESRFNLENKRKVVKVCGVTLLDRVEENGNKIEKILYGLIKHKTTARIQELYLLGIKLIEIDRINPYELDLFNAVMHNINFTRGELKKYITNEVRNIVLEETRMANAVAHLHSQVFPQFRNCNIGKDLVIVGTGPTLNNYNFNKNLVHVGLNKAFLAENIKKLDYTFAIDYFAVKDYIEELKNFEGVKFLGKQANINLSLINSQTLQATCIPQKIIDEVGAYSFYGDAHRDKIFPDIETCPLMDKGSIAFSALQFSLYTSPKRIFLVGCDTSHNGYYDNSKDNSAWRLLNMALDGYSKFKNFAQIYYPDIEIISVNPVGLKGLFRDVYTKSYVAENPELFAGIENDIEYFEDIV